MWQIRAHIYNLQYMPMAIFETYEEACAYVGEKLMRYVVEVNGRKQIHLDQAFKKELNALGTNISSHNVLDWESGYEDCISLKKLFPDTSIYKVGQTLDEMTLELCPVEFGEKLTEFEDD